LYRLESTILKQSFRAAFPQFPKVVISTQEESAGKTRIMID